MARKVKPETRAKRLVETAPASRYDQAYQLALNIVFMEDKLDQAREMIGTTSVTIPYDNGGGQMGIRENPAFKGFHALLKSYMAAIDELAKLIEEDKQVKKEEESPLAAVRNNCRANIAVYKQAKVG
jgi:hypothetical protein